MNYLLNGNSNVENIINIFHVNSNQLLKNEKKCWKLLIEGKFNDAMKILGDIFYDLQQLLNNVSLIETKKDIKINEINIEELFLNIEETIKNQDYVFLADLMEYELKPIVIGWNDDVKSLTIEKYTM